MKFTLKEQAVIDLLHESKVSRKNDICERLKISHMTVVRALKKFGYYTSYNKNSAFYTLHTTPQFDTYGLWECKGICFSRYITLEQTVIKLVEKSTSGFLAIELREKIKTDVNNILSRLCRQKRLDRFYAGRNTVYVSNSEGQKLKQESCRKRQINKMPDLKKSDLRVLPRKLNAITVIKILVKMIVFPNESENFIARALKREGVSITAKTVRTVFEFYSLKKKRNLKDSEADK